MRPKVNAKDLILLTKADLSSNPMPTMTTDEHYTTILTEANETNHTSHVPNESYNNDNSKYQYNVTNKLHMK